MDHVDIHEVMQCLKALIGIVGERNQGVSEKLPEYEVEILKRARLLAAKYDGIAKPGVEKTV